MRKFYLITLLLLGLGASSLLAQDKEADRQDALFIKEIYNTALIDGQGYEWLRDLTSIGGRLSGSPQSLAAVEYTRQMLDTLGLDRVYLQECTVPHWVRGDKEIVRITHSQMGSFDLNAVALGNSIGTGVNGVQAAVIEVHSIEELEKLGPAKLKGKIVFFNRPMDNTKISTFGAYGSAVDQRVYGASEASKYGAVAVLVRSMTTRLDDVPHTGVSYYRDDAKKKIPAISVSTNHAELLSNLLQNGEVRVYIRNTSMMLAPKRSYNVIGEIKGSEKPDEIIVVGGHLDSWDMGTGAHDDGSGCVQSMDVLYMMRKMGYKPKRTIRCVLFMNEENGQEGSKEYANTSNDNKEYHIAAIESDRGGFTPRGFTTEADEDVYVKHFKYVSQWNKLLGPYGLEIKTGGSGADVKRLRSQKGILFGLLPDSQRYFDYHHTDIDTFDAVNKRELQLGAAAMASLVYLLDKYGLDTYKSEK